MKIKPGDLVKLPTFDGEKLGVFLGIVPELAGITLGDNSHILLFLIDGGIQTHICTVHDEKYIKVET